MLNRHWEKLKAVSGADVVELTNQSRYEEEIVKKYMRHLGLDFSGTQSLLEKSGLVLSVDELVLPEHFDSQSSVERAVLFAFLNFHPYRVISGNFGFPVNEFELSSASRRLSPLFALTPFSVRAGVRDSKIFYEFPYAYANDAPRGATTLIRLE